MTGNMDKTEFIDRLKNKQILVDEKITTLVRNTESGSIPPYHEFAKPILRQLIGVENYNRVDKIHLNNTQIVHPSKVGRNFGLIKSSVNSESHDALVKNSQQRFLGEIYVPVRGSGFTSVN